MPRTCTVCSHRERAAIDAALVTEGASLRDIARQFAVTKDALFRHRADHIPMTLTKAQDAAEVAQADTLLTQVQHLQERALGILEAAEQAQDLRTALGAIREARGNLELLAKLQGQLSDAPQINVLLAPEWVALRSAILTALVPYPEARVAVADAVVHVGG